MKKLLASILVLAMALSAMTGCSGGKESETGGRPYLAQAKQKSAKRRRPATSMA